LIARINCCELSDYFDYSLGFPSLLNPINKGDRYSPVPFEH
jgi:hypothetical protein